MQVPLCRHIKTNGARCRGIALTGQSFCYFHNKLHKNHSLYRYKMGGRPYAESDGVMIDLPALEDRESTQLAISKVVNALATNCIDVPKARALFYGLQLASQNARGLQPAEPADSVRDVYYHSAEPGASSPDIAPPGATCEIPDEPSVAQPDPTKIKHHEYPDHVAQPRPAEHLKTICKLHQQDLARQAAIDQEAIRIARIEQEQQDRMQTLPSTGNDETQSNREHPPSDHVEKPMPLTLCASAANTTGRVGNHDINPPQIPWVARPRSARAASSHGTSTPAPPSPSSPSSSPSTEIQSPRSYGLPQPIEKEVMPITSCLVSRGLHFWEVHSGKCDASETEGQ